MTKTIYVLDISQALQLDKLKIFLNISTTDIKIFNNANYGIKKISEVVESFLQLCIQHPNVFNFYFYQISNLGALISKELGIEMNYYYIGLGALVAIVLNKNIHYLLNEHLELNINIYNHFHDIFSKENKEYLKKYFINAEKSSIAINKINKLMNDNNVENKTISEILDSIFQESKSLLNLARSNELRISAERYSDKIFTYILNSQENTEQKNINIKKYIEKYILTRSNITKTNICNVKKLTNHYKKLKISLIDAAA
jgi:hypothetical protein